MAFLLFSKKSRNTIDYKIKALYNNGATTKREDRASNQLSQIGREALSYSERRKKYG